MYKAFFVFLLSNVTLLFVVYIVKIKYKHAFLGSAGQVQGTI